MLAIQLAAAIEAARPSQLDEMSRTLWKGHGAGLLTDEEAQGLAEALQARRGAGQTQKPLPGLLCGQGRRTIVPPRRVGSRPKSAASLERRRRWVAGGMLPPAVACCFTAGQAAVLAVIAVEFQKHGRCDLVLGAIAAIAGVSVSTAKNAIREARRLGLLTVEERRVSWNRSLSNVIRIVSVEWRGWLRLGARKGGGKSVPPSNPKIHRKAFLPFARPQEIEGNSVRRGLGAKHALACKPKSPSGAYGER